jgi:hypothetical protein
MLRRILLGLLAIFILMQFFRPQKNIHPGPQPASIARYGVPAPVQSILEKACNDCHSNNTKYPWYNNIQPAAWFLNQHVKDGKRHLNFDEFANYPLKKQQKKLDETEELVREDHMPLSSYLWIHKEAKLTPEEKKALTDWALSLKDQLQ